MCSLSSCAARTRRTDPIMQPRAYLYALAAVWLAPSAVAFLRIDDDRVRYSILLSALVSYLGFLATKAAIPVVKAATLRAGLFGLDINKKGSKAGDKKIPESLGLASGVVFLVRGAWGAARCGAVRRGAAHKGGGGPQARPHAWLADQACAVVCTQICIVLFQQLHYHDAASFVHWLTNGGSWRDVAQVQQQYATDAWCAPPPSSCPRAGRLRLQEL